jgi:hypothetical protein
VTEHLASDHRVQGGFTGMYSSDGCDQIASPHVFEQITCCPSFNQSEYVLVVIVGGQDEHSSARRDDFDLFGGPNAVELGHINVHERNVGLVFLSQANGLSTITSLGHYQEVFFPLQEFASALSHKVVIVSHEDCDLVHGSLFSSLPYFPWHSLTEGPEWEIYDSDSAIYHASKGLYRFRRRLSIPG